MKHNTGIAIALSAIAAALTATVGRAAPELDCSNFWVDPNTQRSQCLEFAPRTPPPPSPGGESRGNDASPLPPPGNLPEATTEGDTRAAESSGGDTESAETEEQGEATPEWVEIARQPDGLKLFWDKNSLELGREDLRTFWYRQDASDVEQTEQYPYLTKDTKVTVSCTVKTFDFDDINQVGRSGEKRSFRSTFDGVVSEGTPLETVVDAVCAADPNTSDAIEEPEVSSEAVPDASPSQE